MQQSYAQNNLTFEELNIRVRSIQTDQDSYISYDIAIDKTGFLWIGGQDGLLQYDGYKVKRFNYAENSLEKGVVRSIHLNGQIWVGASNILAEFIPETESFNKYKVFEKSDIYYIEEDASGKLWLGSQSEGIKVFNPLTKQVEMLLLNSSREEGDPRNIKSIKFDSGRNTIWVVTNIGLYSFNISTKTLTYIEEFSENLVGRNFINNMIVSKTGDLWLASKSGAIQFDPDTKTANTYNFKNYIGTPNIFSLLEDHQGNLWFGTDKEGILNFDIKKNKLSHIKPSHNNLSLPPATIERFIEDDQHNIWVNVYSFGPILISPERKKFTSYLHDPQNIDGIGYDHLVDLEEDHEGNIWIGTDGGGLDKFNRKTGVFSHFKKGQENSLSSNAILAITESPKGILWLGTWSAGLTKFDTKNNTFFHIQNRINITPNKNLGGNNIFRIEPDDDHYLWLSIWDNGLQRYNINTGIFDTYFVTGIGKESGIVNQYIQDILIDGNIVWIGGVAGLEYFDKIKNKFFTIDALKSIYIFDFLLNDHILWIASSSGLIKFNTIDGSIKSYTTKDGLPSNDLVSIEIDYSKKLWIGSIKGLSSFNIEDEKIENFNSQDGLPGNSLTKYSHLFTQDGHMFFGGLDGMISFDPKNIPRNTHIPNVVLTDIELFQKKLIIGDFDFYKKNINYINEIKLNYNQRDIAFIFSALDFIQPDKNMYRYRLHGLSDEWIEADSSKRIARYMNLSPGKYTFEVIGSNNDGAWNNAGKKISLIILPAWWMRWYSIAMFLLIIGLGIYSLFYLRMRSIHQQRIKLEELVAQKTQLLETQTQSILFHMAFHDSLTKLPNRFWLVDHLKTLIDKTQKQKNYHFSLMFIDGDKFKQINDTYGHVIGDKLLTMAAIRLKEILPENYIPVRLSGDEFTVVIEHFNSTQDILDVGKSIIEEFERPFILQTGKVNFRVSVGIVICDEQYHLPEDVLRDADIAMYRAKENGRSNFKLFDQQMREQRMELIQLEKDLDVAIEKNELYLVYQPIIDLERGHLAGYEALLRWQHPVKDNIPPDKFIPIAEDSGSIVEIGYWVLHQACTQMSLWIQKFQFNILPTIAVNISSIQLGQLDVIEQIDKILHETKLPANCLKLEITESVLLENKNVVLPLLDSLRERGIELSIDDFGTGYSSLSYLDRLPVQVLKIDRSFVHGIQMEKTDKKSSSEIIRATISLAHNLRMRVVAEGIETEIQMRTLCEWGCDYGQGYYLSKPMKVFDAEEYTKNILANQLV